MTARERASLLLSQLHSLGLDSRLAVEAIAGAIERAVLAEREGCAQLVERAGHHALSDSVSRIGTAAAIRRRGAP